MKMTNAKYEQRTQCSSTWNTLGKIIGKGNRHECQQQQQQYQASHKHRSNWWIHMHHRQLTREIWNSKNESIGNLDSLILLRLVRFVLCSHNMNEMLNISIWKKNTDFVISIWSRKKICLYFMCCCWCFLWVRATHRKYNKKKCFFLSKWMGWLIVVCGVHGIRRTCSTKLWNGNRCANKTCNFIHIQRILDSCAHFTSEWKFF